MSILLGASGRLIVGAWLIAVSVFGVATPAPLMTAAGLFLTGSPLRPAQRLIRRLRGVRLR